MYLISPFEMQYKANLHCHSTVSDGKKTPEELKEMYKEQGYSVLAITDHEVPRKHTDLTDDAFIAITGYEAYIRSDIENRSNPYGKEIHMNLLARDPENESIVCYNACACRYISEDEKAALKKVGPQDRREYSVGYINRFVEIAKQNGYIVTYNHPWWSLEDEAQSLQYEGFFSMEMFNYSSYLIGNLEYNAALYDKMLVNGKRIFCHSADDNHNKHPRESRAWDSFGGFTMIQPKEFTYDGIIDALESGNMYSSMGPVFREVSIEGNRLHVACSEVERIMVFTGSKYPMRKLADIDAVITEADFEIDERAPYIRVSIVDEKGRFADTRGYFRDELGL